MTNAEETLRGPKRDVILDELNEVPWRVVDYYIERRPGSHMAALLGRRRSSGSERGNLWPYAELASATVP
jgi:hypothetical protein